jgi:hypothetical protein
MDDEQREFMAVALFWKSKKGYNDDWLYMIWTKRFRPVPYPGDNLIFEIKKAHAVADKSQIESFKKWLKKRRKHARN